MQLAGLPAVVGEPAAGRRIYCVRAAIPTTFMAPLGCAPEHIAVAIIEPNVAMLEEGIQ